MLALFGFKDHIPTKVPTDLVIPLRYFDDTPIFRAFILHTMFVFDDVLNPQKLRGSLEALIERDGWRKLGARLRRNVRILLSACRDRVQSNT